MGTKTMVVAVEAIGEEAVAEDAAAAEVEAVDEMLAALATLIKDAVKEDAVGVVSKTTATLTKTGAATITNNLVVMVVVDNTLRPPTMLELELVLRQHRRQQLQPRKMEVLLRIRLPKHQQQQQPHRRRYSHF
jgi:hypothetical protein